MQRPIFLIAVIATILLGSFSASAQYQGTRSEVREYSVREVLRKAARLDYTDTPVRVRGFIVHQDQGDNYQFRDATGKIRVHIDREDLPQRPFDDKTELILLGDLDYDLWKGSEIDVDQVLFVE